VLRLTSRVPAGNGGAAGVRGRLFRAAFGCRLAGAFRRLSGRLAALCGLALGGFAGTLSRHLLSRRRGDDVEHELVRLDAELDTRGQRDVTGVDRAADLQPGDRDLDAGGDVGGLGGDGEGGQRLLEQAARGDRAVEVDRDVDRDPLAAAYQDQVEMLDDPADRVALDRLRECQLAAVCQLQLEEDVGTVGAQRVLELARRQRNVPGVGAVAVEDGRDLARAPGTPSATLAELSARFGGNTDLGHSKTP
jgi:hypothetical protein